MTDIYSKGMEFQQAGNMRPKAQALMRHRFLSRRSEDVRDPRCSQGTGSTMLGDDIEKLSLLQKKMGKHPVLAGRMAHSRRCNQVSGAGNESESRQMNRLKDQGPCF